MNTLKNILMDLRHKEEMFCDKREMLEMLARLFVPYREVSLMLEAYSTIPLVPLIRFNLLNHLSGLVSDFHHFVELILNEKFVVHKLLSSRG
jgi:hypothetical protein